MTVSRSSRGLKSILKMPGLEPGTSRLSIVSECAYHLRYIPIVPSSHALYTGDRVLRGPRYPMLTMTLNKPGLTGIANPILLYYNENFYLLTKIKDDRREVFRRIHETGICKRI